MEILRNTPPTGTNHLFKPSKYHHPLPHRSQVANNKSPSRPSTMKKCVQLERYPFILHSLICRPGSNQTATVVKSPSTGTRKWRRGIGYTNASFFPPRGPRGALEDDTKNHSISTIKKLATRAVWIHTTHIKTFKIVMN